MPGYYETNYIEKLPLLLINDSIHNIAEYIFNNVYRQPYPAKLPHLLPKTEIGFLLHDKTEFKLETELKEGKIERESHGAQHVSRVAINVVIFLNMYLKFGDQKTKEEINKIMREIRLVPSDEDRKLGHLAESNIEVSKRFIKYLQIAALFHDAGRHGDGEDLKKWEEEGGQECYEFLIKVGCPSKLARRFADAAAKKDDSLTADKDILKKLVQCSDCLDIQRCQSMKNIKNNLTTRYVNRPRTRHFALDYLDIWQDAISKEESPIPTVNKLALKKELVELSLASRSLIAAQSDLANPCPIEVKLDNKKVLVSPGIETRYSEINKRTFEHGGFQTVQDSLKFQPLMRKWYNDGKMYGTELKISNQDDIFVNPVIVNYMQPLQQIIDDATELDQFTISLINLKSQLMTTLHDQFAKKIQNNTLSKDDIEHSNFANLPLSIKNMHVAIKNSQTEQDRLKAIKNCRVKLEPILRNIRCKVATAVAFVCIAAVGAVVGATMGMLAGAFIGSVGNLPGASVGGVFGFAMGAAKGWTLGCGIATAIGLGMIGSYATFWKYQHSGIRDALNQVLNDAKTCTKNSENPESVNDLPKVTIFS